MKVLEIPEFEGLKIIELAMHHDHRGFFVERFNIKKFEEAGLPTRFLQDNHSYSEPGVIRGLHYQYDMPQGKFVSAISGKILDVAVDLRQNSKSYGKAYSVELSCENGKCLWVPAGFAHGFSVLGDQPADVVYKVDALYNAKGEAGIVWNDPDLGINWLVEKQIVSERDQVLGSFKQYRDNPKF